MHCETLKQAIVFRSDLKLGKGKLTTHAGHAAVIGYLKVNSKDKAVAKEWLEHGQKKVTLKVKDEKELLSLFEKAKRNVPSELIHDAGLTQIEPGTLVCLVIGPWNDEEIDRFTKELKLL